MNPPGKLPSGARSKVVERWIGGVTAPVFGSTGEPAWTASVSMCIRKTSWRRSGWNNQCLPGTKHTEPVARHPARIERLAEMPRRIVPGLIGELERAEVHGHGQPCLQFDVRLH